MNNYGITDTGKQRPTNQDCFGTLSLRNGMTLLTVCDGMGGAMGGETASRLALDTYTSYCKKNLRRGLDAIKIRSILSEAVHAANSAVYLAAQKNKELEGMGTTLVSALITKDKSEIFIVNAGDSRAYMINSEEITQLSLDHTYVQLLVDKGDITREEAAVHPDRHVITRAIGVHESVSADIDRIKAVSPAYILLCSDGLHGLISEEDIKRLTLADTDPQEKLDSLVGLANENGGFDNITVVIGEL